ncbi:hypothetical protein TRIP_C20423 [Candidatus Zixiibacteriota bacterium]|nr:hypothetical protein TRIP_C20423 [candidate division Zixibacteria bacterium]
MTFVLFLVYFRRVNYEQLQKPNPE